MNNILAALMFFTRLPFWKIKTVPEESFKHVVSYWSFSGWITGGAMALVFWGASHLFNIEISVILALISRIMITGALHEDGFADFFDGMGGGRDKTGILRIMKDSHIGSYGVLALILYYLTVYSVLSSLPKEVIPATLLCGDTFCKFVCGHIINLLPYARNEAESKAKVVYSGMSIKEKLISLAGGIIPLYFFTLEYVWVLITPVAIFMFLILYLKKKIGGYTGDCCGAVFLLSELGFLLTMAALT